MTTDADRPEVSSTWIRALSGGPMRSRAPTLTGIDPTRIRALSAGPTPPPRTEIPEVSPTWIRALSASSQAVDAVAPPVVPAARVHALRISSPAWMPPSLPPRRSTPAAADTDTGPDGSRPHTKPAPAPTSGRHGPDGGPPVSSPPENGSATLRWATALVPIVAVVLWGLSLPATDLSRMDDTGLISALPWTFGFALALLVVSFTVELLRRRPRGWVLGTHLAALLVLLYGTTLVLYAEPRYSYVYKHIAVSRYVAAHGSVSRPIEIYQNWTGFPALVAHLSTVTGVDPIRFANATQLFFAVIDLLAVRFALRAVTADRRLLALALWVYVTADWIGQNYFAPQALGFVLTVLAVGIVLRGIPADSRRSAPALAAHLVRRATRRRERSEAIDSADDDATSDVPIAGDPTIDAAEARWRRPAAGIPLTPRQSALAALALSLAVVVSHPLSPFLLIPSLVVLVLLGRPRQWWLPTLVAAATVAWTIAAGAWLGQHVNLFADVGSAAANAGGTTAGLPGSPGHQLVVTASRALSLGVWGLAFLGGWRRWRSGDHDLTLPALVLAPFALVLGQSYGGEAIYRVYLFSLPWCALLAAAALLGRRAAPARRRGAVIAAALAVLATLFLVAHFGLERTNLVQPAEVAASTWFEEHAEPDSILTLVAGSFPAEITADYDRFRTPWGTWGGSIVGEDPALTGRALTAADVPEAIDHLRSYGVPNTYLVISPGQEAYASAFGVSPPGTVAGFGDTLLRDPAFEVVWHQDDVTILRLRTPTPSAP